MTVLYVFEKYYRIENVNVCWDCSKKRVKMSLTRSEKS